MCRIFGSSLLVLLFGLSLDWHQAVAQSEDLGSDLLAPTTGVKLPQTEQPEAKPLDPQLQQAAGEDFGEAAAEDDLLLHRVVSSMQEAEAHLASGKPSGEASTAQEHALANLDAMIAQLSEKQSQCSGGQCKKPSNKRGSKSGSKAGGAKPQNAPTTSSVTEIKTAGEAAGQLINDLWGHLPERQREEILQPLSEEFLPEYAAEIEAYFRALADPESGE